MIVTYPLVAISSRLQVQSDDDTDRDNYKVGKLSSLRLALIVVEHAGCVCQNSRQRRSEWALFVSYPERDTLKVFMQVIRGFTSGVFGITVTNGKKRNHDEGMIC